MKSLKHTLLRLVDVTALTFLEPIVRLAWREEPAAQLRKIGRFLVMPVVGLAVAVVLWALIAPKHRTKSGEVPTPLVTWNAAEGIWRFHQRETTKSSDYELDGESRDRAIKAVRERLEQIGPLIERAERDVATQEANRRSAIDALLKPMQDAYAARRQEQAQAGKLREAELASEAANVNVDREKFLESVREHLKRVDADREENRAAKDLQAAVLGQRFPALEEALRAKTLLAEEKAFLEQRLQILETNRSIRLSQAKEELAKREAEYRSATGPALLPAAIRLLQAREVLDSVEKSPYAGPWTLPQQTIRSLACVFTGFVAGALIAIPIGVLCGLSPTFMAVMTPYIALFKPVSPIVWLPIFLIIIGGFIPDPDKNWLIQSLWKLPLIGWMKINPAFLASASTVAMCSLWATMVNTALGVASVDKDHLNVARVLRLGFWSRLFKIVLPSALPLIFAGLRISLGVGWMVLIAAELLASSEGIGKFVWDMFNNGSSQSFAQMFVVVFLVGVIGLMLDRIMVVFQRLVSFDGTPAGV